MFIRSPYNYDGDVVSHQTGLDCSDSPSRTQQHFRDETDINVMVQRFQRTGIPEAPPVFPGVQDFTEVHDFRSAMQAVVDADRAFAAMPSSIRERFMNDPARLLDFISDNANYDEAVRLGIVVSRETSPVADGQQPDNSSSNSSDSSV
nr:MAG: internal scaffolding protein [Microvirus sp.]